MKCEDLKKLTKASFVGTQEEFNKVKDKYKDYDIVYDMQSNAGSYYHLITVFKKPDNIDDWETAYVVDGYFFNVTRHGNTLECWYD